MPETNKRVDFRASASRHYQDGELLMENARHANAGQLFGFAAECGLKWLIVLKGYPTDPVSGEILEKKKKFRVHIHELVKKYHDGSGIFRGSWGQ